MRRFFVCWIVATVLFLFFFSPVTAGPGEDYKEAQLLYLTAVASFAAYPGVDGSIAAAMMRREGWQIIPYVEKDEKAQIKFMMAWKEGEKKPTEHLLAIAGTYNSGGTKLFFRADKVYFAGQNYAEFQANAEKKTDIPDHSPMIHLGFHHYVQAALSKDIQATSGETPGQKLGDLLLEHEDWTVYLTGHSSGGSAATLLGARLISMGVKPEQIKVISFAAPAVGNYAFANKFSTIMDLTRVVVKGDVIPNSLRKIFGAYRQFGREIRWEISGYTFDEKHYPSIYLDCAIRNYYDKRSAAIKAGVPTAIQFNEKPSMQGKRLYIAAVQNELYKDLRGEFTYMRELLLDQYRDTVPAYVIDHQDERVLLNFEELRAKAAEAGCDRMVISKIWGMKRNDVTDYNRGFVTKPSETYIVITIEQSVFNVADGAPLDVRTYENGSRYFTPLGALASAAVALGSESAIWSGQ